MAHHDTGALKTARNICDQRRLSSKEMRAAANVEDQRIGGVQRDERRITLTSRCQPLQPIGISGLVGFINDQIGL